MQSGSFWGKYTIGIIFIGGIIAITLSYYFGNKDLLAAFVISFATYWIGYFMAIPDGMRTGKKILIEDLEENDEGYRDFIFSSSKWYKELKHK